MEVDVPLLASYVPIIHNLCSARCLKCICLIRINAAYKKTRLGDVLKRSKIAHLLLHITDRDFNIDTSLYVPTPRTAWRTT
jgi:hypothetical protein